MDCWIVIGGGNYKISIARSYPFAPEKGVFHPLHGMDLMPKQRRGAAAVN
jgi:hypothetical protein